LLLVQLVVMCLCSTLGYAAGIILRPAAGTAQVQRGADPGPGAEHASLTVMTFNIRWQGYSDGKFYDSEFVRRKPLVLDVLTKFAADIIGLQEASIEQRAALAPQLPGFGMVPLPAEAGDESILYRLNRFDLRDSGHEALRREPEKPGTNIGVRDFVWVYLQDRTSGQRFYVLNLHTDGRSSARGRELDGVLIGEWIRHREFADPVILTGDFNGRPHQPRYLYLTGQRTYRDTEGETVTMPMPMLDTFTEANPHAAYTGTVNAGYRGQKNRDQIDYVFVPRGTRVIGSRIIYYHANGSYPSDHFPLLAEFVLE
jgi:endonuclease/exonuclease/phosphatase family metal-dependent hydrolase